MARNRNSNQLASHGAQAALDQMKYEIAQEFGVQLGADTSWYGYIVNWTHRIGIIRYFPQFLLL